MEPKHSLLRSQEPVTYVFPKPDESSPYPPPMPNPVSLRSILILSSLLPSVYNFLVVSFLQIFLSKLCMHSSPINAMYHAHLILPDLIFIIIFGKKYKLWSSSFKQTT
jgi:hypothetical protein